MIAAFLVVTVFPFYYMLVLSVRPRSSGCCSTPARGWWSGFGELTVATYAEVLKATDNSGPGFLHLHPQQRGVVAVAATVLTLVVAIPGAYAVGRLRFVGRRQVDFMFLAVYLFPSIVLAIPLFIVFTWPGCAVRCSVWCSSTSPRPSRCRSTC